MTRPGLVRTIGSRTNAGRFAPATLLRAASVALGLVLALSCPNARADEALVRAVGAALRPGVEKGSTVAVAVADGLTGHALLATPNAGDPLLPASNLKLVTSAVALGQFGADAVLETKLLVVGDDLVVVGGGDPALGDPALEARRGRTPMAVFDGWADALRRAGVVRVAGDLVVVDPVFDGQLLHPTWNDFNRRQWYGAPVAGVNFNTNCVTFRFVPTIPGEPARVQTLPPAGGFAVKGSVTTTRKNGKHDPVLDKRLLPQDGRSVYTVRGRVKQEAGPFDKPVDDPRSFFGEALKARLAARGVAVAGTVRVANRSAHDDLKRGRPIATHRTPLVDVLGRVNTNSQNMMAEALTKLNGWAYEQRHGKGLPGSWASGHEAAVVFLKRLGIDTLPLVVADGSGLSRENRVSANLLARLLVYMLRDHPDGEHYLASLARTGGDGSLRKRMPPLSGRVFAKTGHINGVSALSGYVFATNGRVAVFSILYNDLKGGAWQAKRQQDAAVEAIAAWLEAQPPVVVDDPEVREAMRHVGLLEAGTGQD